VVTSSKVGTEFEREKRTRKTPTQINPFSRWGGRTIRFTREIQGYLFFFRNSPLRRERERAPRKE